MNVISKSIVNRFSLKTESYPRPFKVTWANKSLLPIKEWHLVTLKIILYSENIYYEVLPMNIAHLFLGHP